MMPYDLADRKYLGEGLFSICYLVKSSYGKQVVLKELKPDYCTPGINYEKYVLSLLNIPEIPKFYGETFYKGRHCLLLEYMDGEVLGQMLDKKEGEFIDGEIRNIVGQLIEVISYMHARGIVHRDLNVNNVVMEQNQIRLIDFGMARLTHGGLHFRQEDYFGLAEIILFLLYCGKHRTQDTAQPWFQELDLTEERKYFIKRLMALERPFFDTEELHSEFQFYF